MLPTWALVDEHVKEEAEEQRVMREFGEDTKVVTTPLPAGMGREEREGMREIARKWNNDNHGTKCMWNICCNIFS